ncbi:MAG: S41 family peptidase [Bacteroidota bacterium]|nr:S41 family peptidase [Bacteroidota bacterium]
MKLQNLSFLAVMFLIINLLSWNCRKDETSTPTHADTVASNLKDATEALYGLMNTWYLWNDSMPVVSENKYTHPDSLLEAMRYKPRDKWSYIASKEETESYFQEGAFAGYGFSYGLDSNDSITVVFVYKNSPLYKAGIRRGWKMLKINGTAVNKNSSISSLLGSSTAGVQNEILFKSPAGKIIDSTFTKENLTINTVLYRDTVVQDGKVIGHIVLEGFIVPGEQEIDEAFSFFKQAGVSDLVLDLRYNTGGLVNVADTLASLIGGSNTDGKTFVNYFHNKNKQKANSSEAFYKNLSNALNLSRLVVLTSGSTASASEAVINGLKPFIKVVCIGDNTYGKPVGMYIFTYKDYSFVPICFRITNANGQGDYYSGLKADSYVLDNIDKDFNDKTEDCFKQALYYIKTGTFAATKKAYRQSVPFPEMKGLRGEIGAY